jgi:hypothetical protein
LAMFHELGAGVDTGVVIGSGAGADSLTQAPR